MINHRVQKYIDHSFCSEYLFRDWEAFLDFIYEEGCRVSSILWWEHCKKNFQHGYGGYSDPDDREWMYSETWLHEDGFLQMNRLRFVGMTQNRSLWGGLRENRKR